MDEELVKRLSCLERNKIIQDKKTDFKYSFGWQYNIWSGKEYYPKSRS